MTFAISAAGTGGHVFPGLAVGQALVVAGVPSDDIMFIGGSRLESRVYPEAGFPFLEVDVRGLQRRLTTANLEVPALVMRAARRIDAELRSRRVEVLCGMGGYVSVPAGLAVGRSQGQLMIHEQNAEAGLANRIMARRAQRVFGSFPITARLPRAEWVGNPIRRHLARFARESLRADALERYGLDPDRPVIGVFGGSLGSAALNQSAEELALLSAEGRFSILHLTGSIHYDSVSRIASPVQWWRPIGFEDRMDFFYAACDVVIARAGGAVAELTATATPAILVPGGFGSGGHQAANANALASVGAAVVVAEADIGRVPSLAIALIADPDRLREMAVASSTLSRPDAADVVAAAMREAHG